MTSELNLRIELSADAVPELEHTQRYANMQWRECMTPHYLFELRLNVINCECVT